jgi:lysozyme
MKELLVGGVSIVVLVAGCATSNTEQACTSNSGQALTVCAKGPVTKGVDVSYYQGTVDWGAVKTSGRAFAFVRVSDGLKYPDSKFTQNWSGTKAAGILRGVYQFFRPGQDPVAQADYLLEKMGPLDANDLPPVMDIEVTDGQSAATIQARMKTWLAHVEAATGRKPLIYTAAFMGSAIGDGFAAYPLWVANYGVSCPSLPANYTSWKFWQSSSTATVPGISGGTDADEFNGTLTSLLDFANTASTKAPDAGSPPPPPSPAPPDDPPAGGNGQTMGSADPPDAGPPDPCR